MSNKYLINQYKGTDYTVKLFLIKKALSFWEKALNKFGTSKLLNN